MTLLQMDSLNGKRDDENTSDSGSYHPHGHLQGNEREKGTDRAANEVDLGMFEIRHD